MTKSQLIKELSRELNLSESIASSIVSTILDSMTSALVSGEAVEIRGFGSLTIRSYDGYRGRNPRTGGVAQVKPKKKPYFRVGKELKEAMKEFRN